MPVPSNLRMFLSRERMSHVTLLRAHSTLVAAIVRKLDFPLCAICDAVSTRALQLQRVCTAGHTVPAV